MSLIVAVCAVSEISRSEDGTLPCPCGNFETKNRSTFISHLERCIMLQTTATNSNSASGAPLPERSSLAQEPEALEDQSSPATRPVREVEALHPADRPLIRCDPPDGMETQSLGCADELLQVGILGKIGFAIQKRLRAFLCIACKEVFPATHVVQHSKGHFHSNHLPSHLGQTSAVDADVHAIAVANGIPDGFPPLPSSKQTSFQGLSVVHCSQCQGCGYIAGKRSTEKWHASTTTHSGTACVWKGVLAQQFQKTKPYFEVSVAETVNSTNPFSVFKEEFLSHAQLHLRSLSTVHNRDITPYLRHTQWHIHLHDYMEDVTKREALLTLIKRPKKDADGIFGALQTLINSYVDEFREKAMSMDFKCREPFEYYPV